MYPLLIASKFGAIGAKNQHGYGVFEFAEEGDIKNINFDSFKSSIEKIKSEQRLNRIGMKLRNEKSEKSQGLPNIKDFFFGKVKFEVTNEAWWKQVDGIKGKLENDKYLENWVDSGSVPK